MSGVRSRRRHDAHVASADPYAPGGTSRRGLRGLLRLGKMLNCLASPAVARQDGRVLG